MINKILKNCAKVAIACMSFTTVYAQTPMNQIPLGESNTIAKNIFTADPSARVFETDPDTVYVYTTHDEDCAGKCSFLFDMLQETRFLPKLWCAPHGRQRCATGR